MAFTWNQTFSDGDYLYGRDVFRHFYNAYAERDIAISFGATTIEIYGDLDPVDDAHAIPAGLAFGGIGWIHSDAYSTYTGNSKWADPQRDVIATDNEDGSDFLVRLYRDRVRDRIGRYVRRTVALAIPDLEEGKDQFGQGVEVGAKGYGIDPTYFGFQARRVYEWDGYAWVIVTPQMPARPDMLDSIEGDIPIFYDEGSLDPDTGEPLLDENGWPYQPDWQEALTAGDYMGIHLWEDVRDVFNLQTRLFHSAGSAEGGFLNGSSYGFSRPNWTWPGTDAITQWGLGVEATSGSSPSDPGAYATAISTAESIWDGYAGGGAGHVYPLHAGYVTKIWNDNPDGAGFVAAVLMQGVKSEVGWVDLRRHRKARLRAWLYASSPAPASTIDGGVFVFEPFGSGYTENRWHLISDMESTEDRDPADVLTYIHTGDFAGATAPGEYPVFVEPADPPEDGATADERGWVSGTSNNPAAPIGIVDYGIPGGFDYQPA